MERTRANILASESILFIVSFPTLSGFNERLSLSCLKDSFGHDVDPAKVADVVELNFIKFLDVNFGDELILPIDEQMKSLEERLERSATL